MTKAVNPEELAQHVRDLVASARQNEGSTRDYTKITDELGSALGDLLMVVGDTFTLASGAMYESQPAYFRATFLGIAVEGTAEQGQLLCRNGKALEDTSGVVSDRKAVFLREGINDPSLRAKAPDSAEYAERKAFVDEVDEIVSAMAPIIAARDTSTLSSSLTTALAVAAELGLTAETPTVTAVTQTTDPLVALAAHACTHLVTIQQLEKLTGEIATELGDSLMKPGEKVTLTNRTVYSSEPAYFQTLFGPAPGQLFCRNGKGLEDTSKTISDYEGFKRTEGYPDDSLSRTERKGASLSEHCAFLNEIPEFVSRVARLVARKGAPDITAALVRAKKAARVVEQLGGGIRGL